MLETLRDLALSLQIYNKGTYDSAKPPYRPPPLSLAASTAARKKAPDTWTFLRIEPEEITYWQQQSAPPITTEADSTANVVNPRIFSVLQEVVHNWQNFLQQNGIERLLKSCNEVPGFELRLTRSRDQFAAYALFFDETPMPFSYPAPVVVQHLGLKDKLSEALLATQIEALFAATYPDSRDRPAYKDRLLELHLNEVFYGANVYGIHDTAARFFIRHPTRSACRKLSTAAPDVDPRHRGFKRPAAGKTGTTNAPYRRLVYRLSPPT